MQARRPNLSRSLIWVLTVQTIAAISTLLDIPFARQVSVFLFLTFIPGFLIIRTIGYDKFNLTELVLFSVGTSLSFLMLLGFLLNSLGLLNLISKPLSTGTLFIAMNISVSIICFLSYLRNKDESNNIAISSSNVRALLFLILPFLTIIGVLVNNSFNNNLGLIIVYIILPVIFVASLFSSRGKQNYPIIIFSIALALLLSTALITSYVYGSDIALEYNVFKETQNFSSLDWPASSFEQLSYKSMLSVTILPTILSNLMNLNGDWIFKIVYSIIFALVPLGLYQLYQIQWRKKIAFASVIFFVATSGFYASMITQAKQLVAELFFVLLFLIILKEYKNYKGINWLLVILLVFGLVVSHYSISYIFIFLILSAAICMKIFVKNKPKITTTLIAFSFCLNFMWYTQIVYGPFEKFASAIGTAVYSFMDEFFNLGARGESVQLLVGTIQSPTFLHNLGRIITNITTLLVLLGFVSLILKLRKDKRNSDYVFLTLISTCLIFSALVIPYFAGFLEMWRLYHIALLFVAPLMVVGIESVVSILLNLKKRKSNINLNNKKIKKSCTLILTSVILVSYFIFQTGLVYEICGDSNPSSIALSKDKMVYKSDFIDECDVFSASWLTQFGDINYVLTYSDTVALLHVLNSYSNIDRRMILLLSNSTEKVNYFDTWSHEPFSMFSNNSYIYLRGYNVAEEKSVWNEGKNVQYDFTELPILNSTDAYVNKIFTNGASEIYYHIPKD
jgi:uncharacterized membrane protein